MFESATIYPKKVVLADTTGVIAVVEGDDKYDEVLALVNENRIAEAISLAKGAGALLDGSQKIGEHLTVDNGAVLFAGEPVDPQIADSVLDQLDRFGKVHEGFIRFLDRLFNQMSYRVRHQLYSFLAHGDFVILPDGRFMAYKAIRADWTDKYSGKVNNRVGQVVSMPRSMVDDDPNNACSAGLHVGSAQYIRWYSDSPDDRIIAVVVDPAHVVSVPTDHDFGKVRCHQYEVLEEVPRAEFFETEIDRYAALEDEDFDDDYEDYEDKFDEWERHENYEDYWF